jgi:hypothetical protein
MRPLYVLLSYGPMALMGGKLNMGKNSTDTFPITQLYTGIWHPMPLPDDDTMTCQLDLWRVIVNMVRFGQNEFINGINTLMPAWNKLETFKNIAGAYKIDKSRLWTKPQWNATARCMRTSGQSEVNRLIHSHVKGARDDNKNGNATKGKTMLKEIVDIGNCPDKQPTFIDLTEDDQSSVGNDGSRQENQPESSKINNVNGTQATQSDKEPSGTTVLSTGEDDHAGKDTNPDVPPQNSAEGISDIPEDSSAEPTPPPPTREKRKRDAKEKRKEVLEDSPEPPTKRPRKEKGKNKLPNPHLSNLSAYQKAQEIFARSLYKLPVLARSKPKVDVSVICHFI